MSLAFGTTTTTLTYTFGASPPSGTTCSMVGWFYEAVAPASFNSWMQIGIPTMPAVDTGQSNTQISTYLTAAGAATGYMSGGGANTAYATGVTFGTWVHVAVTVSGSNMQGYINGVAGTPIVIGGTPPVGNWAGLRVGYFLSPAQAPDAIQDVSFWSRALSQSEVQRCMRYRSAPQGQTGLVAWYPFTNASLADASGNGRNLTVTTGSVSDSPLAPPTAAVATRTSGRAGVGRRAVRGR